MVRVFSWLPSPLLLYSRRVSLMTSFSPANIPVVSKDGPLTIRDLTQPRSVDDAEPLATAGKIRGTLRHCIFLRRK